MANKRLEQINEKWKEFLDSGETPIKNKKVRNSTAVMLENEYNFLTGNLNETTS